MTSSIRIPQVFPELVGKKSHAVWIHYHERKCFLCNDNEIGHEFHYLLTCPYFANERYIFLKHYYYRRPNIYKYKVLMNSRNKLILCNLAKFINIIMNKFQ